MYLLRYAILLVTCSESFTMGKSSRAQSLLCSAMSCCDIRFIKLAMGVSSLIDARFIFLLL